MKNPDIDGGLDTTIVNLVQVIVNALLVWCGCTF